MYKIVSRCWFMWFLSQGTSTSGSWTEVVLPKKVSLDTKELELKFILNGCLASKIKVSLDTTGNGKIKLDSGQEISTHPLYGVRIIYPHRVSGWGKPLEVKPLSFSGILEVFLRHMLLEADKLVIRNKVDGQKMSTHSLYNIRLISPHRATRRDWP